MFKTAKNKAKTKESISDQNDSLNDLRKLAGSSLKHDDENHNSSIKQRSFI